MCTKYEFISWLESIDARFSDQSDEKTDRVYVYSKEEFDLKKKHPRKFKGLYVPYIRVTWDENGLYTRWNGLTGYMTEDCVKSIITNGI